jgi:hypothetical protein
MDYEHLLQWVLMFVCTVMGWFLKELWEASKKMRQDLSELQRTLPINYVQKVDYKDDINRVHDLLDKIYDKLDDKMDRRDTRRDGDRGS